MLDFDLLLESVYPHQMFAEFLKQDQPQLMPYLLLIRKIKLYKAKNADMDSLREESSLELMSSSSRSFNVKRIQTLQQSIDKLKTQIFAVVD